MSPDRLGHESLETTHAYVEADVASKERPLEKLAQMLKVPVRYRADDKFRPSLPHFDYAELITTKRSSLLQ